jgi:hypothetical protein
MKGHMMKNGLKLTLVALMALGITQARAIILGPTTNVVQTLSFTLSILAEGDATTNGSVITTPVLKLKKSTKDIISVLGTATGNTFSTKAKLIAVTSLSDDNTSLFVQDGTNKVDVSVFFAYDQVGSTDVQGSSINTVTGVKTGTDFSIIRLQLQDHDSTTLTAHFDLSGMSTVKTTTIVIAGVVRGHAHQTSATLAGSGDFTDSSGTHSAIVTGTITVTGTTLEVDP